MKARFLVLLYWYLLVALILSGCAGSMEPAIEEPAEVTVIETAVVEMEAEAEAPVVEEPSAEEPMDAATHIPQPTPTAAPTSLSESPTPAPTISALTPTVVIEPRVVEVEWPQQMHLGESDIVRMALIPTEGGYTITTEFPDHETITQDVPIIRPEGYLLYGVGRLNGVGFRIAPDEDQVRNLPLDESVVWHWSLRPQEPGRQRISLSLLLRWVPTSGEAEGIRETVAYSKGLEIQVRSFFGLTRGQAMTTGFVGVVFGGVLSLYALIYRPAGSGKRRKDRLTDIHRQEPNTQLVLEQPSGVQLAHQDKALLKSLFNRYARLVIQSEFLSGYSGARTLLVLPVRPDGRSDAYTIAKIGAELSIQQEFNNYQDFVKHTLPPITARIQNPPVSLPLQWGKKNEGKRAALQYTFIGESGSRPKSMRQALLENPNPELINRLFETFGPNWWMQRRPYTFRLSQEYDRVLPPHYVIEPNGETNHYRSVQGRILDGRDPPGGLRLSIGDLVSPRNFPSIELRADGMSYSFRGVSTTGQPPIRIRWRSGQLPKRTAGFITATRDSVLKSSVAGFELFDWPDPLEKLPHLLEESLVGTSSIIHGDLNLENILVGPGDFVWLIDFATTREGHPLADFAHLEAEVIAHVIAPQVTVEGYRAILKAGFTESEVLPAYQVYVHLRKALQETASKCLANPSRMREYHLALYFSCIGALKYQNLEAHQKHLLYLTAAGLVGKM
jgi:hypothetical protein